MRDAAFEITRALGGDWHGRHGLAPDIGHSPRDRGLKIWNAPSLDGGVGFHSFHGYDFRDIRDVLKARGLLDGESGRLDEFEHRRWREAAERQVKEERERSRDLSLSIWRCAQPAENSPVATYLASRGITLSPPRSLRFSPSLKHSKSGRLFPAMVAAVQSVTGEIVGAHRTFLRPNGDGKADVTPAKMMFGPCQGGAVRFAAPQETLAVGEGIESVLSFAENTGLAAWAALSTSGLKALRLPEIVRDVTIAADCDANGAGEEAASSAAERWCAEGRCVRIVFPPFPLKDFNDARRTGAASCQNS